jgi:Transglycosylase-like domain
MRTRAVLCRIALLAVVVGAFVPPAHAASVGEGVSPRVIDRIEDYRQETWRWQKLMGVNLSPTRHLAERSANSGFHSRTLAVWRERAAKARHAAKHPKRLRAWLCIHRHEGPWNANTGNGYYGGLQMDISFQRAYGRELLRTKGRAHKWLPIEQIWVAERAYRSGRGFYPWPNTARYCGLI